MVDQIHTWSNLLLAYRRACKGKRGQPNVAAFEYRLEDNLLLLQDELASQTYRPGPYTSFYIHEPKRRLISAAPFRDRVVHHALCNVIEPIFERSFVADSYANRVGKGTHRALRAAQRFSQKYRYVLQLGTATPPGCAKQCCAGASRRLRKLPARNPCPTHYLPGNFRSLLITRSKHDR
jgi:RNA-directed DNA polymerase